MSTGKFQTGAREAIMAAVQEIEAQTSAELVVAVRARSGPYRAADHIGGAATAFLGLTFITFAPWEFHPAHLPLHAIAFYALGFTAATRLEGLRRQLTRPRARAQAVRTHAAALFYEAGLANTAAETGVLVYLSLLERRMEIIADRGILKAVPPREWNTLHDRLRAEAANPHPDRLLAGLRDLGALLARHLPPDPENPNELPDAPHFDLG